MTSELTNNKSTQKSKPIIISYQDKTNGFDFDISGIKYSLVYPKNIWAGLSSPAKNILIKNFIYSRTAPLGVVLDQSSIYNFPQPFLKNFIDWGLTSDLPRISEDLTIDTAKLARAFESYKNKKNKFLPTSRRETKLAPQKRTRGSRAILALSFGKDSLLSYGLAKEIGLKCFIASVDDEIAKFDSTDYKFKRQIFAEFQKEQKEKINFLKDDVDFKEKVDQLISNKKIQKKAEDLEQANAMITFILELLPFAYYYQAKYIILGNEKNFDDSFVNKFGVKAFPSYDQTTGYAKKANRELDKLTDSNLQAVSLVEPIYNLAEMKILYSRYPHLLKYMMSCAPEGDSEDRWCYDCPMCAKAFLYSMAVGGDPKKIGLNKNLFAKKYQPLYPLLAKKITRYYEKPPAVREEQLLAFLLAYRRGVKGELMEIFKRKYLEEAEKKEKQLRKKFFGIHQPINIPKDIKNKLLKIYQEELGNLL